MVLIWELFMLLRIILQINCSFSLHANAIASKSRNARTGALLGLLFLSTPQPIKLQLRALPRYLSSHARNGRINKAKKPVPPRILSFSKRKRVCEWKKYDQYILLSRSTENVPWGHVSVTTFHEKRDMAVGPTTDWTPITFYGRKTEVVFSLRLCRVTTTSCFILISSLYVSQFHTCCWFTSSLHTYFDVNPLLHRNVVLCCTLLYKYFDQIRRA